MFQNVSESTIANATLQTRGSSGPSGLNANGWRRILVSKNFGAAGHNLRGALATFVRSSTETEVFVENGITYTNLEAYTACRPIPLDKNPGVRAIGVGEVLRRIVGKAIFSVIKPEIMCCTGNLQLCVDQAGGSEAAERAMDDEESTDALVLVNANNAFDLIN